MNIEYHREFVRALQRMPLKIQAKAAERIRMFESNPYHPLLRNHPLTGKMSGIHAFSVTGSIRIIFEERGKYLFVLMLDIGSHPEVYE